MARNVIYVNNINNQMRLAGIVNLPYTDVILTFLYPNNNFDLVGAGPVFEPNLQNDIRALQNAGKHVLISFGGAQSPGDLLSQAYLYYAADQGGRKVQRLVQ
jgi:hypothetical protein